MIILILHYSYNYNGKEYVLVTKQFVGNCKLIISTIFFFIIIIIFLVVFILLLWRQKLHDLLWMLQQNCTKYLEISFSKIHAKMDSWSRTTIINNWNYLCKFCLIFLKGTNQTLNLRNQCEKRQKRCTSPCMSPLNAFYLVSWRRSWIFFGRPKGVQKAPVLSYVTIAPANPPYIWL